LVATGFVFGSEIVYFICVEENIFPLGGKIGLSVGAGLLCGLAAVLIHYVGYFVAGFQFGLLSAVAGLFLLEQVYHPFTKWIPFGVILAAGILAALVVSIIAICCVHCMHQNPRKQFCINTATFKNQLKTCYSDFPIIKYYRNRRT